MLKKSSITLVIAKILAACLCSCTSGGQEPFVLQATKHPLSTIETEQLVNSIYDRLSPAERIAQLQGMYMAELFSDGRLDTIKCQQLIPFGIGHFSQYASQEMISPDSVRDMVAQVQDWLINHSSCGIPALCHEEVLTGIATLDATIYPQQIGLACSFNTELAEEKTRQTAEDMRKIGGMLALSPMVDVCRNPYFNRLEESYGEDGYLSGAMGVAFVKGLQQDDLRQGIAACSKHFLGYGGGSEFNEKELMEEILFPHEAMIRVAGSKVVMTGYHTFHGTKAVANPELQKDILRKYLGFDGMTVSDYGSINQLPGLETPVARAAAAINAGNDVEFQSGYNYQYLQMAVDGGLVEPKTLEEAVKRVLRIKANLGLLDNETPLFAEGPIEFDTPEERQTSYQLATQSVVLLKNNGVLPIRNNGESCRILVTGPNANSMYAMLGDYTYQAMSYFWVHREIDDMHPRIVSLLDGLYGKCPAGVSIDYTRGCDWTEGIELNISEEGDERARQYQQWQFGRKIDSHEEIDRSKALKMASESDVIIAAMGENTMLCGENRDRGSLRLPGSQEEFVAQLIETGKPVILVMFGGRAQVISAISDRCAAIIQAWYPGEEGGNAVADILYGNISPSGKLSVSYPKVELNENICYNSSTEKDSRIEWPFGYGLSFTDFEYSDLIVDSKVNTRDEVIHLDFNVRNCGEMTADEIVQIYVSPSEKMSDKLKPIQLQGFGRITLAPGETKNVKFIMSPQQFGYYADGQWNIEPGIYHIKVGSSSQDLPLRQDIELSGENNHMPLRTVYFAEIQK